MSTWSDEEIESFTGNTIQYAEEEVGASKVEAEPEAGLEAPGKDIDWRKQGKVNPVAAQRVCNAGWVFAVNDVIASRFAVKGKPLY